MNHRVDCNASENHDNVNVSTIHATTKGCLPINNISDSTKEANIFRDSKTTSLLSLGQLCDNNCTMHNNPQNGRNFIKSDDPEDNTDLIDQEVL